MKPGPSIILLLLASSILLTGVLFLKGCSNLFQEWETSRHIEKEERADAQRAHQQSLVNLKIGRNEMRQGEMLYDMEQYRPAYNKFKRAVDHGAIGSDIENAKALVALLSRKDYSRTLTLGSRIRDPKNKSSENQGFLANLGKLLGGGRGWIAYHPVFEVLALRASGRWEESKNLAQIEAAKFKKPTNWPAPLLMYFANDFTYQEFNDLLRGNPGPKAEAEAILAVDAYLIKGRSATSVDRVKSACKGLEVPPDWQAGLTLFKPLCVEVLKN